MKFVLKGVVFAAVIAVGLGAAAIAQAADATTQVLEQDQQRIFAEMGAQDEWGAGGGGGGWDGDLGGTGGAGGTGGVGGSAGGGGAVVPEPGTMALLGMGLAALGAARRKKAQKKA